MKALGEAPWSLRSYNVCVHNGRVLNVSQANGKLVLTEILLGDKVSFVRVDTAVDCKSAGELMIGCCSLDQRLLVMGGTKGQSSVFAALMKIGEGRLREWILKITVLTVKGIRTWPDWPYLCQLTNSLALLTFDWRNGMWSCEVKEAILRVTKYRYTMPTDNGFRTVPIRLPGGGLLVCGSRPYSKDIVRISFNNGEFAFEKLGRIVGEARECTSAVLVNERFVLIFGGDTPTHLDELWIFDLRIQESFQIRKEGHWHPADFLVPLVVQGDTLYLLGGYKTTSINAIPLSLLSDLIESAFIRAAFRQAFPHPPNGLEIAQQEVAHYIIRLQEQAQEIARLSRELRTARDQVSRVPGLVQNLREQRNHAQDVEGQLQNLNARLNACEALCAQEKAQTNELKASHDKMARDLTYALRERDRARQDAEELAALPLRVAALEAENAALQEQNRILRADLDRALYPRFAAILRLPTATRVGFAVPSIAQFPRWNPRTGHHLNPHDAEETGLERLRADPRFARACQPLLSHLLSPDFFSVVQRAQSATFPEILSCAIRHQLMANLVPGLLLPREQTMNFLVRSPGPRSGAKLMDSEVAKETVRMVSGDTKTLLKVLQCTSSVCRGLLDVLHSRDPLVAEQAGTLSGRARMVVRTSRAIYEVETAADVAAALHCLQDAEKVSQGECLHAWSEKDVEERSVAVGNTDPIKGTGNVVQRMLRIILPGHD